MSSFLRIAVNIFHILLSCSIWILFCESLRSDYQSPTEKDSHSNDFSSSQHSSNLEDPVDWGAGADASGFSASTGEMMNLEGDIQLGVILSVMGQEKSKPCGNQLRESGAVQFVEGVIYAINQVNSNPNLLPGLRLGAVVFDDCTKPVTALARALHFLPVNQYPSQDCLDSCKTGSGRYSRSTGPEASSRSPAKQNDSASDQMSDNMKGTQPFKFYDVFGVIGAESSPSSIMVAKLLGMFSIPQISPTATSDLLSDKTSFPYFMRMSPPDKFQVKAMAHLFDHFNWTYVSAVYSMGGYGESGVVQLKAAAGKRSGVCIGASLGLSQNPAPHELDEIIDKLLDSRARVVVLFTDQEETRMLLSTIHRRNLIGRFVLVGSDGVGINLDDIDDLEEAAMGMLTLKAYSVEIDDFFRYFESLKPNEISRRNPWFNSMWADLFNCTWNKSRVLLQSGANKKSNLQSCLDFQNHSIPDALDYSRESTVSLTIDSVYVFAHALDRARRARCPTAISKLQLRACLPGPVLIEYLKNTSYTGDNGEIRFDENGDIKGRYEVMNFQRIEPTSSTSEADGKQIVKSLVKTDTSDSIRLRIGNRKQRLKRNLQQKSEIHHSNFSSSILNNPTDYVPKLLLSKQNEYELQSMLINVTLNSQLYRKDNYSNIEKESASYLHRNQLHGMAGYSQRISRRSLVDIYEAVRVAVWDTQTEKLSIDDSLIVWNADDYFDEFMLKRIEKSTSQRSRKHNSNLASSQTVTKNDMNEKGNSETKADSKLNSPVTADRQKSQNISLNFYQFANFSLNDTNVNIPSINFEQSVRNISSSNQHLLNLNSTKKDKKFTSLKRYPSDTGYNLTGNLKPLMASKKVPLSRCASPCAVGEVYSYLKDSCCWECRACGVNEVTSANSTKCVPCPYLTWPRPDNFTYCALITPTTLHWYDPIVLLLCTLSLMGVTYCIIVGVVYIRHNSSRLIKSTSRELSYLMWGGVILQYLLPFSVCASPSPPICYISYMGFHISFAIVYASLLTRTNRIYRLFRGGTRGVTLPKLTSPVSQVIIALVMVSIQMAINVVVVLSEPPTITARMPVPTEPVAELTCAVSAPGFMTSLAYNVLLVIVCSYYAFKTRHLPDNFNESRCISLCVYTTLVIWLAFVPSYLTTTHASHQALLHCSALILNASVFLLCLYTPKIYGLYHSEMGNQNSSHVGSIRGSLQPAGLSRSSLPFKYSLDYSSSVAAGASSHGLARLSASSGRSWCAAGTCPSADTYIRSSNSASCLGSRNRTDSVIATGPLLLEVHNNINNKDGRQDKEFKSQSFITNTDETNKSDDDEDQYTTFNGEAKFFVPSNSYNSVAQASNIS